MSRSFPPSGRASGAPEGRLQRESWAQSTVADMWPWVPAFRQGVYARLRRTTVRSGIGGTARLLATVLALLLLGATAFALNFPPLSGRIVDQANVIPADARATIEPKLVDLENKSGIQLVVATVSSLEG